MKQIYEVLYRNHWYINQVSNTSDHVCSWFLTVENCFLTGLSHLPLPIEIVSTKPKIKLAHGLAVVMNLYFPFLPARSDCLWAGV